MAGSELELWTQGIPGVRAENAAAPSEPPEVGSLLYTTLGPRAFWGKEARLWL